MKKNPAFSFLESQIRRVTINEPLNANQINTKKYIFSKMQIQVSFLRKVHLENVYSREINFNL